MFTGLVEKIGVIHSITGNLPRRLSIISEIPVSEITIGESIAIDGMCLTVVECKNNELVFEATNETLKRTICRKLQVGSKVHLERALKLSDRLDGHMVSGHIDAIGTIRKKEFRVNTIYWGIEIPSNLSRFITDQGSITVSGVSLTITNVRGSMFFITLIPQTLKMTKFSTLQIGDEVNIEVDLIARYVERLFHHHR